MFDFNLIKSFDESMEQRNFRLSYTYDNGNRRVYIHNENGINVDACVSDNSFELIYLCDRSIFKLSSGRLSPFYEAKPKYYQYEKMYWKFREIVMKIEA